MDDLIDAIVVCCIYVLIYFLGSWQVLKINPEKKHIESFVAADFELIGYDPHKKIDMKMAV